MSEIEKLDLTSVSITDEKRQELKRLFPEAFTEGNKIDFEKLKLTLGDIVDVGKERYGLNWAGKVDCFRVIQQPSIGTLVPVREESLNFNSSENLFIEGDNLEVLKLLQKSYLGRIKMIYIDPPYNTGNDFIYPDDYAESLETYLRYTGQMDAEGRKYSSNLETDGRFHSKWLCMMYPRLFLARNLLRDDGVIFISIDDRELGNLKALMNEIFGEENFIANIVWQKKQSPQNDATYLSDMHDHILVYARMAKVSKNDDQGWERILFARGEQQDQRYTNPDNDPRGDWTSVDYTCNKTADERPNLYYPIKNPSTGKDVLPSRQRVWRFERDTHERNARENRVWWGTSGENFPRLKRFKSEVQSGIVPSTWWTRTDSGDNQEARRELRGLFAGLEDAFDTPKPMRLIKRMLQISSLPNEGDIILDFFAGSCTTAHAVLSLNHEDSGNRRFVVVQLPEPLLSPQKLENGIALRSIADVGKERIRRAVQNIVNKREDELPLSADEDLGFRVFKLRASCFKIWNGGIDKEKATVEGQLALHIDHIDPSRPQEDILHELLLKTGFPLTTKVEQLEMANKVVFSISDGAMLICLEKELTPGVIKAIAERQPVRVICLDEGFNGNDQLKTNAVQIMKSKNITAFRTI